MRKTKFKMKIEIIHIDISPKKDIKCCQNCKSFVKFGVHLGYCTISFKDKLDSQKCKNFSFEDKTEC
jgi:hypothetical protein